MRKALSCWTGSAGWWVPGAVEPLLAGGRRTSSALLGRGASSAFFAIFCLKLSRLEGRAVRSASAGPLMEERLPEGVTPRGLEPVEAMGAGDCEGCDEDTMDDDDVLGRAAAGGEGARVFIMAGCGQVCATRGGDCRCDGVLQARKRPRERAGGRNEDQRRRRQRCACKSTSSRACSQCRSLGARGQER